MLAHRIIADRYEMGTLIAEGGMGAVYRGYDRQTSQDVAIKMLKPESFAPGMLERFAREGETLRRLNHPNIVKMLAAFEEDGNHFIVMEYVDGGSLRELLRREGRLPIDRALSIALELSDALARTHHLRIIHRDIKPDNVLLAEDGTPRLTDFGVARTVDAPPSAVGDVVGTYAYLCPEGFQGAALDARADVWSFGVLLFEMLAGQRPFTGDHIGAVMHAIVNRPLPDLEVLRPDAPVALVDLIYRMLAKNPDERIPGMRLIGAELEAIINQYPDTLSLSERDTDEALIAPAVHEDTSAVETLLTTATIEPPIPSPSPTPSVSNLPAQTTPFVGREDELAEIMGLLTTPSIRLVTLTGPGGMGKTRLAIEAASRLLGHYPDGVYFVALAPLDSPEMILSAIAEAIRYTFYQGKELRRQLTDCLMEKRILLVLDNFEHVGGGAGLIADILSSARNLKILATSRERLNLNGETIVNIGGMEFPDWEAEAHADKYAAIKLFTQSARRVQPEFVAADSDMPHIIRICQQVRGMPLGILLAASWVEMLKPAEIADEISQNLDFLESEAQDLPTRQRSMRAVFDYSWALLTEDERNALCKLAIFRSGFSREAAQKVTGASLRILMALVNKSLLRRDPAGRYELHELVRQYARERLEAQEDECEATCCEHSAYYLDFLAAREGDMFSARASAAFEEIRREIENIRAAWAYAVGRKDPDIARAITTYNQFFLVQKAYVDGERIFGAAAAEWERTDDRLTLAQLLAAQGIHAVIANPQHAEAILRRSIDILHDEIECGCEDAQVMRHILATALRSLGRHYELALNYEDAVQCTSESLALYRQAESRYHTAAAALSLALLFQREGRSDEAKPLVEECVRIAHEVGHPALVLEALDGKINVTRAEGRFVEVLPLIEETLARIAPKMDDVLRARGLMRLAYHHTEMGRYPEARRYFENALELAHTTGNFVLELMIMEDLCDLLTNIGEFPDAIQYANEQYEYARRKRMPDTYKLISAMISARAYGLAGNQQDAERYSNEMFTLARESQLLLRLETCSIAGEIAIRAGNYDAAETHFRELEHIVSTPDAFDRASSNRNLTEVAYARGDYTTALELAQSALPVLERARRWPEVIHLQVRVGQSQTHLNNFEEARTILRAALQRASQVQVVPLLLEALLGVALLKAKTDDPVHAQSLASMVIAHPATLEKQRREAKSLLGLLPMLDGAHSSTGFNDTLEAVASRLLAESLNQKRA